jgi:hypothetical protein
MYVTEVLPSQISQQFAIAIAAVKKEDERVLGKVLNSNLGRR